MTTRAMPPESTGRDDELPADRTAGPCARRLASSGMAAVSCLLCAAAAAPGTPGPESSPPVAADEPVRVTTSPPAGSDRRVATAAEAPPSPGRGDRRLDPPSTLETGPERRGVPGAGPAPTTSAPRRLTTHGPAALPQWRDGVDPPAGGGRLHVEPGRFMPAVAAPGRGVAVEAIVRGAGGGSGAGVRVVAHVRAHAALDWTVHEMRRLPGPLGRWQTVIPCSPCLSEPEVWLQAIAARADGVESAWWPPAGGSAPADYAVGYERVVAGADDAVLGGAVAPRVAERGRGLIHGAGATWTGPTWPLEGVRVPMIRLGARLDAGPSRDAALEILVRPGGLGPWTRAAVLESPVTGTRDVRIDVRDQLPDAAAVQVRVRLLGGDAATARVEAPRLADLVCSPGPVHGPDVDGDGVVGLSDLVAVMSVFGPCDRPAGCREDVDGSGTVDLRDALDVIAAWEPAATASASGAA